MRIFGVSWRMLASCGKEEREDRSFVESGLVLCLIDVS